LDLIYMLPCGAAMLASAWSASPLGRRGGAALGLALASLLFPAAGAGVFAGLALAVAPKGELRWGVAVPAVLLALFQLRLAYGPALPGQSGFWASLACLVLVVAAAQQLLGAEDGEAAGSALARGQAAWLAFGFLSPVPLGWSGGLLLLWQQPLLRLPLARVLAQSPGRVLLAGGLFLGLAGGPPFSAFNAYFQLLAPLMTESAAVASMQARLYTSTGLLAVVAILALLYQTGAFGYFYWSRVLPAATDSGSAGLTPLPQPWAWAALGLSLAWGIAEHFGGPGRYALETLRNLHALPPS
jgi:hypothetical protein